MTIDKAKLKALAEAATPGPWEVAHANAGGRGWEVKKGIEQIADALTEGRARFIAAANPTVVLTLLAENEQLKHDVAAGSAREWDLRSQVRSAKESRARVVQSNKVAREDRDQLKAENERLRKLPTCWSEVLEQSEANDQLLDKVLELSNDAARLLDTLTGFRTERDQLKAEVARSTEREIQQLAEIEALRNGMLKIIEMNRQHAEDQYGDADKAESWGCVTTARETMRKVMP